MLLLIAQLPPRVGKEAILAHREVMRELLEVVVVVVVPISVEVQGVPVAAE